MDYLNYFILGIEDLLDSKIGIENCEKCTEDICKLIFSLKKNFNVFELTEKIKFIENIYNFTKYSIMKGNLLLY